MIHRKWSLLTGPVAILGGVVATVAVANFILVKNDPFVKPEERKFGNQPANKQQKRCHGGLCFDVILTLIYEPYIQLCKTCSLLLINSEMSTEV